METSTGLRMYRCQKTSMGNISYIHFIVLLIVTIHQPVLSQTKTNCSPLDQPDMGCIAINKLNSNGNHNECKPDVLKNEFPHLYYESKNHTPGKPNELLGNLFEKFFNEKYPNYYPGVNITFRIPSDGSIYFLKGFELMINRFTPDDAGTPESVSCVIFDVSNITWITENYGSVFQFSLYPLSSQRMYLLELYSLPKPPIKHDQYATYTFITPLLRNELSLPKDWVTAISYRIITGFKSKVYFEFLEPPNQYKFTEFLVYLVDPTDTPKTIMEEFIKIFSHEFDNVDSGVYEIWIEPVDDFRHISGKCYCFDNLGRCVSCIVSKTPPFNVTNKNSTASTVISTTSTSVAVPMTPNIAASRGVDEPSENVMKIVLAFFGSLIGISLVLLSAFFLYRNHKQNRNNNYTDGTINQGNVDGARNKIIDEKWVIKRKTIHLLYFKDHDYHIDVVESLVDYLETFCSCSVLYAPWHQNDMEEGLHNLFLNSIQYADFTLVIHSEASFRHYMARKENKMFQGHDSSPLGDVFMPSFHYILDQCINPHSYKKYIMAYFEYSKSEHIPEEVCPGVHYKLMKHFKELLCHIHGITPGIDNLGNIDLPLDGRLSSTAKGFKLITACQRASDFEKKNPEWFYDIYGAACDIEQEHSLKHDSGIDTCSRNLSDDDKISVKGNDDLSWIAPSELLNPEEGKENDNASRTVSDIMAQINDRYEQHLYGLGMQCVQEFDGESLGGQSV